MPFKHSSTWRTTRWIAGVVGPFSGLIVVLVLFSWLTRDTGVYLTIGNLKTVAVQTAIIGTCGIGMTLVIIGGGIDLSVGSAVALVAVTVSLVFNGVFFARLTETLFLGNPWLAWSAAVAISIAALLRSLRRGGGWALTTGWVAVVWLIGWLAFHHHGGVAAAVAGVSMGAALGLFNGTLITSTRVVPFIITLGTMEIFRGTAQLLARGEAVPVDMGLKSQSRWLFNLMVSEPMAQWMFVGPGVWIMVIAGLAMMVVLTRMPLGRRFVAVGSNERAAELSGVAVAKVKLWMYGLAGLMTGLAGVMQYSRLSYGSSTAGAGLELDVIAAVVIGGGSLRGGEGSVVGTFIGAFIMGLMRNGCDLAGIPNAVQRILIGGIIILAVAIDEWRHRH